MARWMRRETRKLAQMRAATAELARILWQAAGAPERALAVTIGTAPSEIAEAAATLEEPKRAEFRELLQSLAQEAAERTVCRRTDGPGDPADATSSPPGRAGSV